MGELDTADVYLEAGSPLPLDVAAALMGRGYDVPTIERNYAKEAD